MEDHQHSFDDAIAGTDGVDWLANSFEPSHWFEDMFTGASHEPSAGIVGTPDIDASFWHHQSTNYTCAVVSQQMILQQFGIDVSEAQLVYDATTHGWLTSTGTSPADLGELLEYYGVPCHRHDGADLNALVSEIARGHKVVVGIDGGEIWKTDFLFEDWFNPRAADHAVVVTGIDVSDPSCPKVHLNDPGDPHGAGRVYPLDDFLDAWADSGNMYVATDHAPGDLANHPIFGAHFNSSIGMYFEPAFWIAFLDRVLGQVQSQDQARLSAEASSSPPAAKAEISVWQELDDADRNELFMLL